MCAASSPVPKPVNVSDVIWISSGGPAASRSWMTERSCAVLSWLESRGEAGPRLALKVPMLDPVPSKDEEAEASSNPIGSTANTRQ